MYKRTILSGVISLGALLGPKIAAATTYTVNCGTNGSAAVVQSQVDAVGSTPGNTLAVTGTCVGSVTVSRADRLSVSNLSLTGSLTLDSSVMVSFSGLHLSGDLNLLNTRKATFSGAVVNGPVTVNRGSLGSFSGLTMSSWSDSSGVHDPSFDCIGQSECTVSGLSISGSGTAAGTGAAGLLAASASRLNVYGGTISGFDIGVQVWNNATAFLTPICDDINIQSNLSTGVYTTDGGIAKIEGMSAADAAASGCVGIPHVFIARNGRFGVLADGGGNAYLYLTAISGHSIDGVRVQHGSTVRVRSSTIDAATASGRSARVTSQAHLYFDEQGNGPTASSTLAGPVCVAGTSSVDTDNSSTVIATTATCGSP
jgi:hypothetical protein